MSDQDGRTPGIGKRQVGTENLDLLLHELRDFKDDTRLNAALELGRLGDPRAVEPAWQMTSRHQ
jgi:HEAT repeat protein